jgi:hypothetical protein
LKVAVTLRSAAIEMVQPAVPVQAPPQPAKVAPGPAEAVRVTAVPEAMLAEQIAPQLRPPGLDVTVPVPVPALVTVSVEVVAVLEPSVMFELPLL